MSVRQSCRLLMMLGLICCHQSYAQVESASPVTTKAVSTEDGKKPNNASPPPLAPTPKLSGSVDPFEGLLEDFQYDPVGKRDPFAPFSPPKIGTQGMVGPVFPLQRFSIEQLKLQGIIWDVNSPKALVLDPSNRAHIIVKDDRIGQRNGYVAQIREDEVIIVESIDLNGRTIFQTRVLRMATNSEKK